MHVLYDSGTLRATYASNGVGGVIATHVNPILNALITAQFQAATGASTKYGEIADDTSVLAYPADYLAVESSGVITGMDRTKSIGITFSATSIFPDETSTITLQLRDKNLNPDLTAAISMQVYASNGLVYPGATVSNASGVNTVPLVFRPSKQSGFPSFNVIVGGGYSPLASEADDYHIEVKTPVVIADQNWAETNDIKPSAISGDKLTDGAVTPEKLSDIARMSNSSFTGWRTVNRARIINTYDLALGPAIQTGQQMAVAGEESLFVWGLDTSTGNNKVKDVNKKTGYINATYDIGGAYTLYGMVYDGPNLYIVYDNAGTKMDVVSVSTMTNVTTYSLALTPTSITYDGEYMYVAATGSNLYKVSLTGAVLLVGAGNFSSIVPIMNTKDIIWTIGATFKPAAYTKGVQATNAIDPANFYAGVTEVEAMATDGSRLWFGVKTSTGDQAVLEVPMFDPNTGIIPAATAILNDKTKVGYDGGRLIHDGINLWMICPPPSCAPFTFTEETLLKKIKRDVSDVSILEVIQTIRLGNDLATDDPIMADVMADGQFIWIVNSNVTV